MFLRRHDPKLCVSPPNGFSLVELLLVVTILGILSTVAVPSALRARKAAEKAAVINNLRTLSTHEATYMSVNGRYARLGELNTFMDNSLGTMSGNTMWRGEYQYRMFPSTNPTDAYLSNQFAIRAIQTTRVFSFFTVVSFEIRTDQSGTITLIEE